MSINKDVFIIEDNKIIINMEKFYDNLTLVRNKTEFQEESRLLLRNGILQCEEFLKHKKVMLRKVNAIEFEFVSIVEFREWLMNPANKALGIELVYIQASLG